MWLRRLAAPRPVGPMPMTRTSTLLQACCQYVAVSGSLRPARKLGGGVREENIHVSHCESWIEALSINWRGGWLVDSARS